MKEIAKVIKSQPSKQMCNLVVDKEKTMQVKVCIKSECNVYSSLRVHLKQTAGPD